jgi:hypothetical protein
MGDSVICLSTSHTTYYLNSFGCVHFICPLSQSFMFRRSHDGGCHHEDVWDLYNCVYSHYMSKMQPWLSLVQYPYTRAQSKSTSTWRYCKKIDSSTHLESLTINSILCTPLLLLRWRIRKADATLDLFLLGKICLLYLHFCKHRCANHHNSTQDLLHPAE